MPNTIMLERYIWTLLIDPDGESTGLEVEVPGEIEFTTDKTAEEFPNLCTGTSTEVRTREDFVDHLTLTIRSAKPDNYVSVRDTLKRAWRSGMACLIVTPGAEENLDMQFDPTQPFNVRWAGGSWWITVPFKNRVPVTTTSIQPASTSGSLTVPAPTVIT